MNVTKQLHLVGIILSLVTTTACGKLTATDTTDRKDGTSGSKEQSSDKGSKAKGPSLALSLPEDMKDSEDAVAVADWNYKDQFDVIGTDILKISCDGKEIKSIDELSEGKVYAVFELSLFAESGGLWKGDGTGVSFGLHGKGKHKHTSEDEKVGTDSEYANEDDASTEPDASSKPDAQPDYAVEQVGHISFPYTCEGDVTISLNLEDGKVYTAEANLYSPEMDLLQFGSAKAFDISAQTVEIPMNAVQPTAKGQVDLQVVFAK